MHSNTTTQPRRVWVDPRLNAQLKEEDQKEAQRLHELRKYDIERALPLAEAALQRFPESLPVKSAAGYVFLKARDFTRAGDLFTQVLERDPLHKDSILGWARMLFQSGDERAAIASLRDAEERLALVGSKFESADDRVARVSINNEIGQILLRSVSAAMNRGTPQFAKIDEAKEAFSHALAINANHVVPLSGMGDVHLLLGDLSEAKRHYERANLMASRSSHIYCRLGNVALLEGDIKDAHYWYGRVLDLDPEDPKGLLGIAALESVQGDRERALKIVEQVLSKSFSMRALRFTYSLARDGYEPAAQLLKRVSMLAEHLGPKIPEHERKALHTMVTDLTAVEAPLRYHQNPLWEGVRAKAVNRQAALAVWSQVGWD